MTAQGRIIQCENYLTRTGNLKSEERLRGSRDKRMSEGLEIDSPLLASRQAPRLSVMLVVIGEGDIRLMANKNSCYIIK